MYSALDVVVLSFVNRVVLMVVTNFVVHFLVELRYFVRCN